MRGEHTPVAAKWKMRGVSPPLKALDRLKSEYGGAAPRKAALLRILARTPLGSARQVLRLHEALVWLRAYPDDAAILRLVERMLRGFAARRDLRRHARALENSGIAGTRISYRFFHAMAEWLAARWPRLLAIDWDEFEEPSRLDLWLPILGHDAETPGFDELPFEARRWLEEMRGEREGDGAFLVRRMAQIPLAPLARERLYDAMDPPMVLLPGPGTPSRTAAKARGARIHFQRAPLRRARPPMPGAVLEEPLAIRLLPPREGERYATMAREAMVTRSRDLDGFSYADPRDAILVDWDEGLQFAVLGMVPEKRLVLETVSSWLTLRNGVPIGYVLVSALNRSSEVAYNVFEAYRGGEAGFLYGRVLATTRALFGSDAFAVDPYQLGDDNEEAIDSGAWWFYQKFGFRARDRGVLALMRRELARMRKRPGHRSSKATLRRLAREYVFYYLGPRRDDVLGLLPLGGIGLAVTRSLARRFGSDRDRAREVLRGEAAALCGVDSFRGWSAGERLSFDRFAPILPLLPGVRRWSMAERRALAAIARAKGGRRERDFVRLANAHPRFGAALARLAGAGAR